MLTDREQFKVAFLLKAAQLGMTLEETHDLIKQALAEPEEKEAGWADWVPGAGILQHAGKKTLDVGADVARKAITAGMYGVPLATVGIGGLLGHTAAKAQGFGADSTPEEEKQRELIDAYRRAAEQARMGTSVRKKHDQQRSRVGYGIV